MIGGRIIENAVVNIEADNLGFALRRRLWCVDRNGDECAVYVEDTPEAASLQPGETAWWQSGVVYARNDTLELRKLGYSFAKGLAAPQFTPFKLDEAVPDEKAYHVFPGAIMYIAEWLIPEDQR